MGYQETRHASKASLSCERKNMADLSSAIHVVNDLVVRLDRVTDASEIGLIVLRLDFLHRMLVNLCVDQDITDTLGSLCSNAAAIETSSNTTSGGYHPPCSLSSQRGRPVFEISNGQLSFLLEQGFKIQEISCILGVSKRTVERRMKAFGLSVSGR